MGYQGQNIEDSELFAAHRDAAKAMQTIFNSKLNSSEDIIGSGWSTSATLTTNVKRSDDPTDKRKPKYMHVEVVVSFIPKTKEYTAGFKVLTESFERNETVIALYKKITAAITPIVKRALSNYGKVRVLKADDSGIYYVGINDMGSAISEEDMRTVLSRVLPSLAQDVAEAAAKVISMQKTESNDYLADFRRIALGREIDRINESTDEEIAKTIGQQMGGIGKLKVMLGAKVMAAPKGLKIKWPNKERSKGNVVVITLTPADEYDMEFFNGEKSVKKFEGLYAEDLKRTFEKHTGWYLSL
jgi:hypothetical protein